MSNSRRRELGLTTTMTHHTHYAQACSPCFPQEEEGEWVWVPKKPATPALPDFTLTYQSPMYRSFSAVSSESQATAPAMPWNASPVSPNYSTVGSRNDTPSMSDGSPTQPLLEGFDVDPAFDVDALLGNVDHLWDVPAPEIGSASGDLFTNWLDAELLSGMDLQLELPQEIYGTGGVSNSGSPPLPPLTPASPPTPNISPASTSPVTPTTPQLLPCSDVSCTRIFTTRSDLRRHERKHRQPFGCPLPRCGKGHLDRRALNRHLWAQHPDYAQRNNIPSEKVRCPHCAYESRRDNVARHVKKRHAT